MEERESNQPKEIEKFTFIRDMVLEELDNLSAKFDQQMEDLGYSRSWSEKAEKIRAGEKLDREQIMLDIVTDIAFPRCSLVEFEYVMKELFKPPRVREIREGE